MSLFEDASLIVTPNGFKAGKLYSIKPTNGDGDLTVVRATTATRVNSAGLIETVANNVPRLDYTNGSCPSILVEPQRTNLLLRSEEFDNAGWGKNGATITPNTTVAPNGTLTADTFSTNVLSTPKYIQANTGVTGDTTSFSFFVKKGSGTFIQLTAPFSAQTFFNFNTESGVVGNIGTKVTNIKVETYPNGWFRVSGTFDNIGLSNNLWRLYVVSSNTAVFNETFTTITPLTIFIWGAQLEVGSNATSYIPTVASSVTRNADVISKTGISDLIGQSEGTLFVDAILTKNPTLGFVLQVSDGTQNNRVQISLDNVLSYQITGSNLLGAHGTFSFTNNTRLKMAFAYKSGDSAFFINGVKVTTILESSLNVPTALSRVDIGRNHTSAFPIIDQVNQTLIFKTRLTNAQLEALTTL